jgi:hypothetical protein
MWDGSYIEASSVYKGGLIVNRLFSVLSLALLGFSLVSLLRCPLPFFFPSYFPAFFCPLFR